MKEKKKLDRKVLYSIIAVAIIVLIVVGASIAYFSAIATTTPQEITSANVAVDFTEGNIIRSQNIVPISDAEINSKATELPFTIANSGTEDVGLKITLSEISLPDNLKNIDFRWGLFNSDTDKAVARGIFKNVTTTTLTLIQDTVLDASTTKNYKLRIWIHDNGADQNNMQGESFSAKVNVTSQILKYTDESCFAMDGNTLVGYSNTCPKDVVIPKTINGVTVTSLGESNYDNPESPDDLWGAFNGKGLTSVVIPNTVTSIEGITYDDHSVFGNNPDLESITLPESITSLGWGAFMGTRNLKSVTLPDSITSIAGYAFCNSGITSITIPGTVKTILDSFFEQSYLDDVVIMDGVTTMGAYAFTSPNVTTIEIPASVNRVTDSAFRYSSITEVVIRGKSSLSEFSDYTGLTEEGGLPTGVNIIFRP